MSGTAVGFLMFGNLIRECGVLDSLSKTAQTVLANLITLLLGISIAAKMRADLFVNPQTLMIMGLGLIAFIFDTVGGVLFAKLLNMFSRNKINPMIGAAGISAMVFGGKVRAGVAMRRARETMAQDYGPRPDPEPEKPKAWPGSCILPTSCSLWRRPASSVRMSGGAPRAAHRSLAGR